MKKFFLFSSCLMFSLSNAGKWKHKLKKAAKKSGIGHVVGNIVHQTNNAVSIVNNNVTIPVGKVVTSIVKPVTDATKDIVKAVDKNVAQPVAETVKMPIQQLTKPIMQTQKYCLSHVKKDITSIEKLTIKPLRFVEHEFGKVLQPIEAPWHFLKDTLVDFRKELSEHAYHKILETTDHKELHILFKCIKGASKVFKGAVLLETKENLFQAVMHYFLPIQITALVETSHVIEATDLINKLDKHYKNILEKLGETKNNSNDISGMSLNDYARLLIKHQIKEEHTQSIMLLSITKNIGKGIEETINCLDEHRIQVPNHPIGNVDWK